MCLQQHDGGTGVLHHVAYQMLISESARVSRHLAAVFVASQHGRRRHRAHRCRQLGIRNALGVSLGVTNKC